MLFRESLCFGGSDALLQLSRFRCAVRFCVRRLAVQICCFFVGWMVREGMGFWEDGLSLL